jgi:hypothetical protein
MTMENGVRFLLDAQGLRFRRTKPDGTVQYTVYGFNRDPLSTFEAPAPRPVPSSGLGSPGKKIGALRKAVTSPVGEYGTLRKTHIQIQPARQYTKPLPAQQMPMHSKKRQGPTGTTRRQEGKDFTASR